MPGTPSEGPRWRGMLRQIPHRGLRRSREGDREQQLRELLDGGETGDLPGRGLPLAPDPDEEAGEAWAARHVMRTARVRPAWAELRQEIAAEHARLLTRARAHLDWLAGRDALLRRLPAERIVRERAATKDIDERVGGELAVAVEALNALAARHDLMVPAGLHLPRLTVDRLLELARAASLGEG